MIQAWRLDRTLDTGALERALGTILTQGHHDHPAAPAPCDVPDLAALRDLLAARPPGPPDPCAASHPRVDLYRLRTQEHVLVVSSRRGLWNGWSQGVFCRELAALYAREAAPPSCGPHPRARPAGRRARHHPRPRTADRTHPARDSFTAAAVHHRLDPGILEEAAALAHRCGVPPYAVLLACLRVLLARWSGLKETTVLMPPAGPAGPGPDRTRTPSGAPAAAPPGPVVLLHGTYRPDEAFDALVAREATAPAEDPAREDGWSQGTPPLPVRFSFRVPGDPAPLRLPGTGVTDVTALLTGREPQAAATPYDMSLDVTPRELVLRYAEELFDQGTVRLLASHYGDLLAAAVSAPATCVASIAFAPPAPVLRAPGPLTELLRTLPDSTPATTVTGARIVGSTDGAPLPAGLHGRLQLQARDATGRRRWKDTAVSGRHTPDNGILIEHPPAPGPPAPARPAPVPPLHRGFGGDAAGMAAHIAGAWAAKLGLAPAGAGDALLGLGGGLTS